MLNTSINAPNVLPDNFIENETYNEIESISEWVIDIVIFGKNIIQEDDDANELKKKNSFKITISHSFSGYILKKRLYNFQLSNYFLSKQHLFFSNIIKSIFSPPEL